VNLGLASHAVPSASFAELRQGLIAEEPVDATLARLSRPPGEGAIAGERATIDRAFSAPAVPKILSRLDEAVAAGAGFARKTAATIRLKSPTSLAIALEQMRRGGDLDFEEAMRTEFRVVSHLIRGHDFYEGVRATIIDKDGSPRWRPPSLDQVDASEVQRHFADLDGAELKVA
jgi:enoyl-CoA hydratase